MNNRDKVTARQAVQIEGKWFKRGQGFAVAEAANPKDASPVVDRERAERWCAMGWAAWGDDAAAAKAVEGHGRKG